MPCDHHTGSSRIVFPKNPSAHLRFPSPFPSPAHGNFLTLNVLAPVDSMYATVPLLEEEEDGYGDESSPPSTWLVWDCWGDTPLGLESTRVWTPHWTRGEASWAWPSWLSASWLDTTWSWSHAALPFSSGWTGSPQNMGKNELLLSYVAFCHSMSESSRYKWEGCEGGLWPSSVANYSPPQQEGAQPKIPVKVIPYLSLLPTPSFPSFPAASSYPKKGAEVSTHLERTSHENRSPLLHGDALEHVYKYTLYYFTRMLIDRVFHSASEGHLLKIKSVKIVLPCTILRKSFH